jgi:hypothetical protein
MKTQRRPAQPLRCEGCSILVGPGYLSERAWPSPDGCGIVCCSCRKYLAGAASKGRDAVDVLNVWRRDLRSGLGSSPFLYSRVG